MQPTTTTEMQIMHRQAMKAEQKIRKSIQRRRKIENLPPGFVAK